MKRLTSKLASVAMAILLAVPAFAQNLTVSGTVTDTGGEPVFGAAVMVKGTTKGVTTDLDGKYSLSVASDAILVCQNIGYKTVEVAVNGRATLDFVLETDAELLDATVVVGYGTLKKTQLVGAVETVDGETLQNRTNATVSRSLQGQVAGLSIGIVDGKASHPGSISIRGNASKSYESRNFSGSGGKKLETGSMGQGGSCLVMIDGVEGDLSTVNPEDVESISVLKDAASCAVYGARGAFGVILVTTKKPATDRISANFNASVGINRRTVLWEDEVVTDGYEWAQYYALFSQFSGSTPVAGGGLNGTYPTKVNGYDTFSPEYVEELRKRWHEPDYEYYQNPWGYAPDGTYLYYGSTNWFDLYYKDYNITQNYNFSISGSSKKTSFSVSGRYYNQDGIYNFGNEKFNSISLRAKGSVEVTKWFKISENAYFFKRKYHQPTVVSGSYVIQRQFDVRAQPVLVPLNEDGTTTFAGAATCYTAWHNDEAYQENDKLDLISTTTLDFTPIKDVLKISADITYKAIRSSQLRLSPMQTGQLSPIATKNYNEYSSSYKSDWRYNTDYIAANVVGTWTPKLGEKHDLNVMAGWNIASTNYRRLYLQRKGVMYPQMPSFELMDIDTYSVEDDGYDRRETGFFARVNYTLFNRYIFELAGRYDGSSRFPVNQRWGFFPSGSFGWRISEEPWMKGAKSWLNNLKLRANAGSLGNANISDYAFLDLWEIEKSTVLINGEKVPYTISPTTLVPESLTWETITTYDVGLDFDLFKNRLSFSGDFYIKDSKDLLIAGPKLPEQLGASTPKGNYGSTRDIGYELQLQWKDSFDLGGKPFRYSIKGVFFDNVCYVTNYYNPTGYIIGPYNGKEWGEIWGFRTAGIFASNDEANDWNVDTFHQNGTSVYRAYAGDLKYVDIDGDGKIGIGKQTLDDHGDLEVIGNEMPRYQYGLNFDFSWNGIGLSIALQGIGKKDWYFSNGSGFFYGMYDHSYGYMLKDQIGKMVDIDVSSDKWVVTNMDKNPYWTSQRSHVANRNVGPLATPNDHFLQNVGFLRLKNLTLDYTFPAKLMEKAKIKTLKVYFSGENLACYSPLQKHNRMCDPEVIEAGDTDTNNHAKGYSGMGEGYSYPMLMTFTFGINLSF